MFLPASRPASCAKTIVRGTKAAKDGSLTWLLDEFENMSVSRSNSLRRDSPPFPPRRDQLYQENGLSEGPAAARPHEDAGRSKDKKLHGARGELEQGKERPRDREEQRAHPQQPRGQEPGPKGAAPAGGRPPPPEYPKPPERDGWRDGPADRDCSEPAERVVRRERAEPSDRRPKSTYTGETSPQSPRDKRPLSGPNIRTPNIPVSEGVMKTAQQTGRPFNTYPRAETDPVRGAGSQVKAPPLPSAQSRPAWQRSLLPRQPGLGFFFVSSLCLSSASYKSSLSPPLPKQAPANGLLRSDWDWPVPKTTGPAPAASAPCFPPRGRVDGAPQLPRAGPGLFRGHAGSEAASGASAVASSLLSSLSLLLLSPSDAAFSFGSLQPCRRLDAAVLAPGAWGPAAKSRASRALPRR